MNENLTAQLLISLGMFVTVFMLIRFGWPAIRQLIWRQEMRYDAVLNRQLLMNIHPRIVFSGIAGAVLLTGLFCYAIGEDWLWFFVGAGVAMFLPNAMVNHLELKRKVRLENQLVDGITSLASGVRAGLNLVQSMQLLVQNMEGPIKQEFEQLLREYELGVDLNQAMTNASNRIGSSHYRLLFSAIAAHRTRGGDVSESLDRITDAVREIQRLEGKLQTLTAQGRNQAWMMAAMSIVVLLIAYAIEPDGTAAVLADPYGRVLLLIAAAMIFGGVMWIRSIMTVDI
jgi:tight adherence protein B